ncbi:MAG TPA: arabinan endo-1,5-alpha-L-arabinosidase, partial [Polyangiaceae bacterium]
VPLTGDLVAHDPVIIKSDGLYYVFHTGPGVRVKTSSDMREWSDAGSVFNPRPSWTATQVPGVGDLWAPDISYFGGTYHLYYSASTFGSNRSCIGHATRAALNSGSWTDHGPVICSNPDGGTADNWNAIDPNVVLDEEDTPWLSFGSFWDGIKMIELDQTGARANMDLHSLASRTVNERSVEAPFIVRRCNYYYLFVSFDFCCRGTTSTYRTMVGRSTNVLGPYVDRSGNELLDGGGTQVLVADTRWRGPGHNAIFFEGSSAYNVYHTYDAQNQGRITLRISELAWDVSGWPVSAGP